MRHLPHFGAGVDVGTSADAAAGLGEVQAVGYAGVAMVSASVRTAALALLLAGAAAPLLVLLGAVLVGDILGAWWSVAVLAPASGCAAVVSRRVSISEWFDRRWPDELPGTVVLRAAGMVCLTAAGTWTVRWTDVAGLRLYSFPWRCRGIDQPTRVEVYLRTHGGRRLELRYDTLSASSTTWRSPAPREDMFGEVLRDRVAAAAGSEG